MILKCVFIAIAIEVTSCINLLNELYPKGQRKKHFNSDFNSSVNYIPSSPITDFGTDLDKLNTHVNYFPDVIYPTCILDNQPFYYNANSYDIVIDPFSEPFKPTQTVNSNSKNNKRINSAKGVEYIKTKPTTLPSTLICKEENIRIDNYKKQECDDDLISQQDNTTILEETNLGTENNIFTVDKDEILKNTSLISSCLLNNLIKDFNNASIFINNEVYDIDASIERENVTNNITVLFEKEVLDQNCEMKNETSKESIKEDYQIQIRVKINIDVLKIFPEKQNDTNNTHVIHEYISSKENETFLSMDKQQKDSKCSAEEMNILPEYEFKLLHEVNSNDTELPSLLFEFSKDNEILYPILQLCNGKILDSTFCKATDNNDDAEPIETCCEDDNSFTHFNNDNITFKTQTKYFEDKEESNEEYFLDFIVSLATLCQMNDTISNNISESQENDVLMNSVETILSLK